jgi:hypothetical protein
MTAQRHSMLALDGFAFAEHPVPAALLDEIGAALGSHSVSRRQGGRRDVLQDGTVCRILAGADHIHDLAKRTLGPHAFCARALLFDKNADANWKVPWHQDLTIAVKQRHDVPGFGPWTIKDRVAHTHAPVPLLQHMVALRIHLDDCGPESGPLYVLAGSHLHGRLGAQEIAWWSEHAPPVRCTAARGEVLLLRPLVVHRSSPAERVGHRRVLHLEFAAGDLPRPLAWRWRIGG